MSCLSRRHPEVLRRISLPRGKGPLLSCVLTVCAVLALGFGCAEDRRSTSQPGDALLRDPMGYRPTFDEPNISGGDIGHFDKKAFKKDWDSVFNP
jgi:hypothetical protein